MILSLIPKQVKLSSNSITYLHSPARGIIHFDFRSSNKKIYCYNLFPFPEIHNQLKLAKTKMSKLQALIDEYARYLAQTTFPQSSNQLLDFKTLIQSFVRDEFSQISKQKFVQSHLNFLLQLMVRSPQPLEIKFTLVLQLSNFLLRSYPQLQIRLPNGFMSSLARHLSEQGGRLCSGGVVANVIWLVCKCVHGSRDRGSVMANLSQSRLLEVCLGAQKLDGPSQRGLSLLLSYMCKRQLQSRQIYLTLVANIHKFSQTGPAGQVLGLLSSRAGLEVLEGSKSLLQVLGVFLIIYIKGQQVAQRLLKQNWRLIVLVAHTYPQMIQELKVQQKIQTLLSQKTSLSRIYTLLQKLLLDEARQKLYLNLCLKTLYSNKISRRIFVQHHQKITAQQFVSILSGELPLQLEKGYLTIQQGENQLKLMICMKRIATRLGLNNFYNYKLGGWSERFFQSQMKGLANQQLLDLFRVVTENNNCGIID